jgi:hypothetical protein
MPMPYAHLSLAHGCTEILHISNYNEFYIGAIAPDMRYFTKKPREEYHFSLETLYKITRGMTVSSSFITGYMVHLMIDELWYTPENAQRFRNQSLIFLRNRLSPKLIEAAFEFFCFTKRSVITHLQSVENELTVLLGIKAEHIDKAINTIERYNNERNLQVGIDTAIELGIYSPSRLDQMQSLSKKLKMPFVERIILELVKRPSQYTYQYIVDNVVNQVRHLDMDFGVDGLIDQVASSGRTSSESASVSKSNVVG